MQTLYLTPIQVTFDSSSQGQVAMVIYEWADAQYLGKVTDPTDDSLPVSSPDIQATNIMCSDTDFLSRKPLCALLMP